MPWQGKGAPEPRSRWLPIGSVVVAGTVGTIGLTFFAPMLADAAIKFGPPEFFALMVLGLVVFSYLSGKSSLRLGMMVFIGVMIGTIGDDPIMGINRRLSTSANFNAASILLCVVMGIFGLGEVVRP